MGIVSGVGTRFCHDEPLFVALLAQAGLCNSEARAGAMFGSPAVFVGPKMAACVLDGKIGMRVPVAMANPSLGEGRAGCFRPYDNLAK